MSKSRAGILLVLLALAVGCGHPSVCGAGRGAPSASADRGLRRDTETVAAMALLGLHAGPDPRDATVFFLGYPNLGLTAIAAASEPFTDDPSGLHRTYAEDGDGDPGTCDGDLRFRLDGRHAPLTAAAFAADLDALLALTRPTDVYGHTRFDGHPDHAAVAFALEAALARSGLAGRLHGSVMHPEGTGGCMGESAREWPNPADPGDDPYARFTPGLDVEPPPLPPCARGDRPHGWGAAGPPDELVLVPPSMQDPDPGRNLKWQVLSRYASQVDCARDGSGARHPSCGYMRAFVKRAEFFWTQRYGPPDAVVPAGPVLVVGAHPDDEALGAAGVIAAARAAGRRVYVAVVTNGDSTLR